MNKIKITILKYAVVLFVAAILAGCNKELTVIEKQAYEAPKFFNPVVKPSLFNSSVLRTWDGWFYAYGSEENWVGAGGNRLMPVMKSADMVTWTYQRNIFNARPSWSTGAMTSPDVVEIERRYYVYYSFASASSTSPKPSIALATSVTPMGPFVEREDMEDMGTKPGNLFDTDSVDTPNPRHPFFFQEENGDKYLFYTSNVAGDVKSAVYCLPLSASGQRIPDFTSMKKVASADFDGVLIQKKDNFYYLFGTRVNGNSSTIIVGRSANLLGPYVDKTGGDLMVGTNGTIFAEANALFSSPGHNSKIFTDKSKEDWIMFHVIDSRDPKFTNNLDKKPLVLARIVWNNGWPELVSDYLTEKELIGPNFY
ncbi:arabinan endo-1,5-alpha-L-arabinosidase [Arcticibacter tournemirensis]|uniref:family 43 glycosylhydrolase n=1 Tax=Arcticibacter tournemirensis TaxID=699437 RepID=UPI001151D411|nr:family 43 glycosylhydrolase [Arcticibacter tournemirensis]TQM51632.1 arabinan endo-1,5-alpha-L-arabinosidase [Arcticibacter tournemirensis]